MEPDSLTIPEAPCWQLTCDNTTTTTNKECKVDNGDSEKHTSRSLVAELYKKGLSNNERLSNGQFAGDFALAHVISHLKTRRRNYNRQKLRQN